MLGSIIRYVVFIALIAAVTWGIFLVLETPGEVVINFADREVSLQPIGFLGVLAAGFLAVFLIFKFTGVLLAFYRFLAGDDSALTRYFNRDREKRGFDALGRAMTALASGDANTANAKAAKAEQYLDRPELTRLVTAQAAQAAGNTAQALKYYRAIAEDRRTAFVGVKGLLEMALEEGDDERALKLAQQAHKLKPKDGFVLESLYNLQTRSFDWHGARTSLAAQRRLFLLSKTEANRREAMLALAQAEDAETQGRTESARQLAVEAAKLDPTNAEAVAAAARHLAESGSKRAATRLITHAWADTPSAQLAQAYAAVEPDESPYERKQRFGKLFEAQGTGTEANLVRAELALSTEDWAGARAALENVDEDEPSARTCAIRAAIARGEGEPEAVVRGWLAKALGAPRGTDQDNVLGQAAMLPLLVGDQHDGTEDAEEVPPEPGDTGDQGDDQDPRQKTSA